MKRAIAILVLFLLLSACGREGQNYPPTIFAPICEEPPCKQ